MVLRRSLFAAALVKLRKDLHRRTQFHRWTLPATIKDAIERKLKQEQESLEYEFRLVTATKEAEKVRIEAQGKADANRILSASLNDNILQDKGIEATLQLANSANSKVIVIGGGEGGLPIILGNQ